MRKEPQRHRCAMRRVFVAGGEGNA